MVSSRSLHVNYFSTKVPVSSVRSASSDLDAVAQKGKPWIPMASIGWGWATSKAAASAIATEDAIAPRTPARGVGCAHSYLGLRTASEGYPESIISCGYWDHAVRLHFLDYSANLPLGGSGSGGHRDQITCICIADGGSLLVTGGQDATCRVWVVGNAPMAAALGSFRDDRSHAADGESSGSYKVCVHILYGHEAPVTCLAVSEVRSQAFCIIPLPVIFLDNTSPTANSLLTLLNWQSCGWSAEETRIQRLWWCLKRRGARKRLSSHSIWPFLAPGSRFTVQVLVRTLLCVFFVAVLPP